MDGQGERADHAGAGRRRMGLPPRKMLLAGLLAAVAAGGLFASGYHFGHRDARRPPRFHDIRVNHVADLIALVDPGDPDVRALADALGTPEAAYAYVRDRVRYAPMTRAERPGAIIRAGAASCLGKAALLCSLYRSMGIPAADVRIITGNVALPEGIADHAWIDLEYKGVCLQQDPSGFLGVFDFAEFPGMTFTRSFVEEEDFCFNDEGFAVISQLNRFRDVSPAGFHAAP